MESVVQSMVAKVVQLLNVEYQQLSGLGEMVTELSKDLATMNAVLLTLSQAEEEEAADYLVREWEKQLRELAYDAGDCIDLYKLRIKSSLDAGLCTRMKRLLSTLVARRHLEAEINGLRARATAISERHERYGVDLAVPLHRSSSRLPTPRAQQIDEGAADMEWTVDNQGKRNGTSSRAGATTHAVTSDHLMANPQLIHTLNPVGVEEDMYKLQCWMEKEDEHSGPAVLSIVGFAGVGKTTIATTLYRDFGIQFDCRASVTVSQNYDEDQVLRDILCQINPRGREQDQQDRNTPAGRPAEKNQASGMKGFLKRFMQLRGHRMQGNDGNTGCTQSKMETMGHYQLIQELQWRLKGRRYILLIDDVWSVETWENIRNWFPPEKGSKVIVTSRFQDVGAACSERDGTDYLHIVNVLNDAMSESLFNQAVGMDFSKGIGIDNPYEEIWKYCGGLPLAIVTMAGLVACNPTKKNDYWSTVCKSLFPHQVATPTLDGVTRILEYCYNDLPSDLKTCSLYLSIFPKGSKISKKRLTRRWISECFVTERQGLSAEEVAEIYFNQLVSRKIIRPEDHSSSGKVKSFKVHDMILEYIVSKSSKDNFVTVVGGHWLMSTPGTKIRRLSMQSSGSKDGKSKKGMNLFQVRSVTVFGRQSRQLPFYSFNNGIIRVLDLEGWKGMKDKYLNDICKMLVLKYLSLRRTEVVHIPSKIGKLEYLETLDIRETRVEVLPKAFGQLKRLRSMLGGSKNPKKALKLPTEKNKEPMKELRILSGIEINKDSAAVASLHQLTGLIKLAIYKLNIQEGDQIFKQILYSIEYLSSCGLQTLAINDEGSDFINSLDSMSTPPRYLIGLELSGKMENPPKWIKDLSNLYRLTLSVTVLRINTFQLIQNLPKLFSLTFTLTAEKDDRAIVDILEENKLLTDRQIIVPPGGFESLKLLRFFATLVPRLSFAVTGEDVMPALERIDMRFQAFEGIYGIETLKSLQELHLSVSNQADEETKSLVEQLKDNANRKYLDEKYATKWPKIISD